MMRALAFLLIPLFCILLPASISSATFESSKTIPNDLDYFYDMLNARFASFPKSSGEVNPLYHILGDKLKYEASVRPEDINQLYQLMNKDEDASLLEYNGNNLLYPHVNLDFVNLTIFHRYDDVRVGKKMPLFFTNQGPRSARLVKNQHPKVLSPYAKNPQLCEKPMASGEHRACVESLEEMMDFVGGLMGKDNVKPISTPVGKWQMYTVVGPARTIHDQVTGCHKQDYVPFAVYGCHYIPRSQVRVVPLVGEDGTKLDALSVCHMDTSSWNPHHLLFFLLKAKPGPPVCHFLAIDDLMWVTK